jgi:18S rRNA (guanine1575-N7)-methyltransferase
MTDRALELLQLPPDEACFLLDIGCGSGLSGEILDEDGHYWVGVDVSPSMLGEFAEAGVAVALSRRNALPETLPSDRYQRSRLNARSKETSFLATSAKVSAFDLELLTGASGELALTMMVLRRTF